MHAVEMSVMNTVNHGLVENKEVHKKFSPLALLSHQLSCPIEFTCTCCRSYNRSMHLNVLVNATMCTNCA